MSNAHSVHEAWRPQTRTEREAIIRELEGILASPHFCNSKRYPALLRYIVENALAGKTHLLKERTIGVEVFDRPVDYDTNADTAVRYTAGEVRKRLLLYYSEEDHASGIRISLPVGSYLPEFFRINLESTEALNEEAVLQTSEPQSSFLPLAGPAQTKADAIPPHPAGQGWGSHAAEPVTRRLGQRKQVLGLAFAVLILLVLAAVVWSRSRGTAPDSVVDDFWAPALHNKQDAIICTGSVVFTEKKNYSGVITASRDIDYPFVSWQGALAIAQISGVLSQFGASAQLASAPSTALTDLREHTVVLLGAYNNQWTLRFQEPLRFVFHPGDNEVIEDRLHPGVNWKRDQSLPYDSADDYAVVARFRDPTIDDWIVMLAGVGRNGTEAAAQFATSPHYLGMLRERAPNAFSNGNIEAVLRVNVIEGKTGAPSILAVHTW